MSRIYYVASWPPFHIADGAALATSVTLTDISPLPAITLPGGQLELMSEVEIDAAGSFSNTATPTLLLGFYLGGVAGVAIAASSAITTAAVGAVSAPWELHYRGRIRATGVSGSMQGSGRLYLGTSLTAFAVSPIPTTLAARTFTWDTTANKIVTVGAQWGTSSASNTITCNEISLRLDN